MKIRNESGAYGFLAGLITLLLGLLVANCACFSGSHARTARIYNEYDAAVDITVVCMNPDASVAMWAGSGVIVDSSHVLTAGHVANPGKAMCSYTVETRNDEQRNMFVKNLLVDVDLASLELSLGQKPFDAPPVRFGPAPRLGDEVCAATAHPTRTHKCGEAQPPVKPPGDIVLGIIVEPGNSGSGLYDSDGQLVGIVTHRYSCSNGQICGGKAASLVGHLKDLL